MIDSHAHLNFNAFRDDWREVLERSFANGITAMINIGSNYKTSERAVNIAKEYNQSFAAVGLHPIHTQEELFDSGEYRSLIRANERIVKAVGETGLDYFHQPADIEKQKEVFLEHLNLAKEFDLPVILHCRGAVDNHLEAYNNLLEIIQKFVSIPPSPEASADAQFSSSAKAERKLAGVLHCFSANWEIAQKFLELNFYIGFTGIVTYSDFSSTKGGDEKSRTLRSPALVGRRRVSDELLDVVARVPLEKMLIETDSPYLTPEPHRGERCEPWYVKFTAEKIAAIKKITLEEVIEQTTKNAKELFKI